MAGLKGKSFPEALFGSHVLFGPSRLKPDPLCPVHPRSFRVQRKGPFPVYPEKTTVC